MSKLFQTCKSHLPIYVFYFLFIIKKIPIYLCPSGAKDLNPVKLLMIYEVGLHKS